MGSIWYDWSTTTPITQELHVHLQRHFQGTVPPAAKLCDHREHSCVLQYKTHNEGTSMWFWHKPPGMVLMTGSCVQLTASTASGSMASAVKNMNFSSWSSGLYPEAHTRHHHAQWCWRSLLCEIIEVFLFYFLLLAAVVIEVGVMCFLCIFSTTLAIPPHHFCFRSLF
jgi:hypothetical protein